MNKNGRSFRSVLFLFLGLSATFLMWAPAHAHGPLFKTLVRGEAQAMAPLLVFDPRDPNLSEEMINAKLDEFSSKLESLKGLGITSISVDVWWGIVQTNNLEKYDWTYYEKVFERITRARLEIVAIMALHSAGGNVGDSVSINLPQVVLDLLPTLANGKDARYMSEGGNISTEVISSFAINLPRVRGVLHPLDLYENFFRAFRDRFAPIAKHIVEIVIPGGPAGESTRPAYHAHDRNLRWRGERVAAYPNRGALQASSEIAGELFENWLKNKYQNSIEKLNEAYEAKYSSFDQINFYKTTKDFEIFLGEQGPFSPLGQDFFEWNNDDLIDSTVKIGTSLAHILKDSPLEETILAKKTPGIHWNYFSRLALLIAAQISSREAKFDSNTEWQRQFPSDWEIKEGLGYKNTLTKIFSGLMKASPTTQWKEIFTCADQDNHRQYDVDRSSGQQTHGAYDLVRAVGGVLQELGIAGGLENSLGFLLHSEEAMNRMRSHIAELPAFYSVTFLRMDEFLWSQHAQRVAYTAIGTAKTAPVANRKLLCSEALTQ